MIIMPDADMDQAVDAAMGAAYGSAGERCMAVSAVLAVGDETGVFRVRDLPAYNAFVVVTASGRAAVGEGHAIGLGCAPPGALLDR